MIKHILSLIWNERRKYMAILSEQVLVFIVLMIAMVSLFDAVARYRSSGQLDTKNVIYLGYMVYDGFTQENLTGIGNTMDIIISDMKEHPYVEDISESIQLIPYLRPPEYFWGDSLTFSSGTKVYAHTKATDASAEEVFRPEITQGRWFRNGERPNGLYPAVITAQLAEKAGMEHPLGRTVKMQAQTYEIVGVISGLKETAFDESYPAIVVPISSWNRIGFYREYAARIKPGYEDEFYIDYFNGFELMGNLSQYVEPILSDMSRWKADTMTKTVSQVSFIAIPTLFLVIFAFLGTMGLNMVDMKSRTREFALRMAVGSSRWRIVGIIILRNVIISSVAAIPGLILVLSAYELNRAATAAILVTLAVILFFSVLSSLYPAIGASGTSPAQSLKYE